MVDGKPYDYIFCTEEEACEEAYKMGITNVYVYTVMVAT